MIVIVKENPTSGRLSDQRSWWDSNYFHDGSHLIVFILASENGHSNKTFKDNATETPHVNRSCVGNTQHNFWCPVKSGLNVGVEPLQLEAATAVIYQLYL